MRTPTPPSVLVDRSWRKLQSIGASPWLIRQLQYGIQLPWLSNVPYRPVREYPLSDAARAFATAEQGRWIQLGFVRKATASEIKAAKWTSTILPAFVARTGDRDRLVIDYQLTNECLESRRFRMDRLSDLAAVLKTGDKLFKGDVKDAYYHLRLRLIDQLRLMFIINGTVYVPLCMNCGLSVAPWFFTKAMRPVMAHLRSLGHRVFAYLDDFFGAARPRYIGAPTGTSETVRLGRTMRQLFRSLGLRLHPTKQDFAGRTSLTILGITVDTERQKFLLPPDRLAEVELSARRLLEHAARNRRHVRVRDLRSFTGLANSTAPAVVDARLRLRELFNPLRPTHSTMATSALNPALRILDPHPDPPLYGAKDPRLSHAAMRDLKWWSNLSANPHVGRLIWPCPEASLFTDASMRGWGGFWNGRVPAAGFFTDAHAGSSINELEVPAALEALQHFVRFARSKQVLLITDSQVTEHIVRNLTTKSPRILSKLRALRKLCEDYGVSLSTRHIPSVLNCWADSLSRRRDQYAWSLPPTAVALLQHRFATLLQVMDGQSLPGPQRLPENAVVLPRPSLLGVWGHRLASEARGILVAPAWPSQPWFHSARRACNTPPTALLPSVTLPCRTTVFDFNRRFLQPPLRGVNKGHPVPSCF